MQVVGRFDAYFSVCIKDSVFIDPACGSGSLLIRAADEAPFEIAIWGQEKEVTTAGLAKMNLVLHNKAAGEISAGNTFSSPHYFEDGTDDEVLKHFDFAVANPPFSLKNWTDGLKDYQANMSNQGFSCLFTFHKLSNIRSLSPSRCTTTTANFSPSRT